MWWCTHHRPIIETFSGFGRGGHGKAPGGSGCAQGVSVGLSEAVRAAGRARTEAWRNFADRLGLDEARALATMLRQSEELGTSVGETLRVFAIDMREKRMLYAEEKALALPAKLVVPLILFVFPSLLTVLMLPAVVRMMEVMAAT